jgi:ABC-type multidrug transport system fused ATPase/permease subunit
MADQLSFSTALAVLIITPEFFLPLRALAIRYHAGAAGRTAAERLTSILETPPSRTGPPSHAVAVPTASPAARSVAEPIRFREVWFGHRPDAPVLQGFDLDVAPGRLLALVGASGAGKSTTLALLLRFAELDRGTIHVGDTDLRSIPPADWRSQVAWVPQRPNLGSGTIADAIALADPEVDDEAVVAAARLAQADTFVRRLRRGYATPIGESGVRLSGGQRQRLALARAFLRDGPVLILDEPTSHLDARTEAGVVDAIRSRVPGRVVLVVSHRRRVVEAADEVAVMEAGRIVQSGTPDQLADREGPYRRIVAASRPERLA